MREEEVRAILAEVGAVLVEDHFIYTSGKHGDSYVNKDAIYPHTVKTSLLCQEIAERCKNINVEVVAAPAVGAIIISQWVAYHLTNLTGREVLCVYADKEGDSFVFKRGYDKLVFDRRVLVVEDLFTTGASARKLVALTRATGGSVGGVAGFANRGRVTRADVGAPRKFITLTLIDMRMYDPTDCPLCKAGVPINTKIGHGKQFLVRRKQKV